MTTLLDVNVLVALAWPNHVHHAAATTWFSRRTDGWATCPVTESGFVRVSSNRRIIPGARTVAEALGVLRALRGLPGHEFWSDDVSLATATEVDVDHLAGHRQVTDAHLLTLAQRRGGRLVSFDQGITALAADPAAVEVLLA